jgi:hypothetical protein
MKPRRGSKLAAAGVLVVLSVFAAASPALAKPLTEQQWRTRANAICTQSSNEIGALDAELLADYVKPTPEQASVFVGRAVPVFEKALAAIDALEEPKALSPNIKRLVRTATRELDALSDDPTILVATEGNALPKARKLSAALGIKCLAG